MFLKITWTKSGFIDIQDMVKPENLLTENFQILEDELHWALAIVTDSCHVLSLKGYFIFPKANLPSTVHLKGIFIKAANKNTFLSRTRKKNQICTF